MKHLSKDFAFKGAVFDLDGTLLDTLQDIADAANHVLKNHNLPIHPVEDYRYFVGDGVKVLISRVIPEDRRTEELLNSCLQDMKDYYIQFLNQKAKPYPAIPDIIKYLKSNNVRLGVLSNKPHHLTEKCIEEFFPSDGFSPVLGLKDDGIPKPDPNGLNSILSEWDMKAAECLYFGDTAVDMQTAVNAGCFPIGVLWGFRSQSELVSAGARLVIDSFDDFFSEMGHAESTTR